MPRVTGGVVYEITVKGRLSPRLVQALPGFEVVDDRGGHTRLRGTVADQAGFQGVVQRLGDLCVEVEAIQQVEEG